MGSIHTSTRGDAHGYTRSETPWIIDEPSSSGGRLAHYISGGGIRSFGRTIQQEEAHRKHVRFLTGAAVFFVLWLVFLFV